MADILVNPLLKKLAEFSCEEIIFQLGINDKIKEIRIRLENMKGYVEASSRGAQDTERAKRWVNRLRENALELEDALDEFTLDTELLELNTPPCNFCQVKSLAATVQSFAKKAWMQFWFHQRLKTIDKRLLLLEDDKSKFQIELKTHEGSNDLLASGSGYAVELEPVGIDKKVKKIAELIEKRRDSTMVITLWGAGGSGKTTLAEQVYERVKIDLTIDCCSWVNMNHSNIEFVLRKTIIDLHDNERKLLENLEIHESNKRKSPENLEKEDINSLQQIILKYLKGKRYVLFFDDVWDDNLLTQIKIPLHHASSIIITSRAQNIACGSFIGAVHHVEQVEPLEFDLACSLFCKLAFCNNYSASAGGGTHTWPNDTIKEHGEAMVERCNGLPLAILAVARLMSTKDDPQEWMEALKSLDSEFEGDLAPLYRTLLLSYNELPTHLKDCFLYCAMFSKAHHISAKTLIRLCIAEGFVKTEDMARKCFLQLRNRSLLQIVPKDTGEAFGRIQMHDLFLEVAWLVIKREMFAEILDQNSELELKQRRLVIQGKPNVRLDNCKNMKLRTLIINEVIDFNPFPQMLQNIKLLRVLVLESRDIEDLPDEVGDLLHLRYISLRGTGIVHLPDSLGRLHNLQTLDLRKNWRLKSLPKCVSELKKLRHLFGEENEMPDIDFTLFSQLQTLSGVRINTIQASGLENFTQLTTLKIYLKEEECWRAICSSVKEMTNLRSLCVWSNVDGDRAWEFGDFSPPLSLRKLRLSDFGKLTKFTSTPNHLRVIQLRGCDVDEDFFISLEKLPSLVSLELGFYGEKLLCTAGSFPKLKVLRIKSGTLTKWEIGKGAMKCLQSLTMRGCRSLEMLPEGLRELENLEELYLLESPQELVQRMRVGGPDRWKVEHIPTVSTFDKEPFLRFLDITSSLVEVAAAFCSIM